MTERVSALAGHCRPGRFGEPGDAGVVLREVPSLVLWQIATWPESLDAVAEHAARLAGAEYAPAPCAAVAGSRGSLLRIEPVKWWLHGVEAEDLDPQKGTTLDLSHARTQLQVSGVQARACLNRLIPLDLREVSFPLGSVATTVMHHVSVTLWRSEQGYQLLVPRGFAVSLWEVLLETARQFGVEVE